MAILLGPERVSIEERPVPDPAPGEVVVRIRTATTCATDLKSFLRGGHPRILNVPGPFGHEFCGTIEGVGRGVRGFSQGDRVAGNNSAPCMECPFCARGRPNLCEDPLYANGSYAEYYRLPSRLVERNLLQVPESVSDEMACFLEPLACVLRAVEESGLQSGDTAAVLGDGPSGLMMTALLAPRGVDVVHVGGGSDRLALARRLGATEVVSYREAADPVAEVRRRTPGGRGADGVLEAAGRIEAWDMAARMARKGAKVILYGGCAPGSEVSVSTERIHYDEVSLIGLFHNTPDHVRRAMELLAEGSFDLTPLVTHRMPLGRLTEALGLMRDHQALKVSLDPAG